MSTSNYPIGFPEKNFAWKGKSLYQIVHTVQLNTNKSSLSVSQLRKPLPLKIYRKEIHNINGQNYPKNCNPRISTKITDIDMPGSTIVSEISKTYSNGLVNTLDINPTTLAAENGSCNTQLNCFSPAYNARKRVRSAGMIPKKFDVNKNNDTYSSSTQQYLVSRNKTIKQNEFHYIRKGNSGMIPGPGLAASNIYSPGGLSHCQQPLISVANNNNKFSYKWNDLSNNYNFDVIIPDGKYDPFSLNQAFQAIQIKNNTYLNDLQGSQKFLLTIGYNTITQNIILIANEFEGSTNYSSYTKPNGAIWNWTSSNKIISYFNILNNKFADLIGFLPGTYTGGLNGSSFCGSIWPNYVTLHYKPNNPEFGVQGAVDSSARIHRIKYTTITSSANLLRSAYGDAAANALAYGVSEQAYTAKTTVGDKPKLTPVINPKNGNMCYKQFIYRRL